MRGKFRCFNDLADLIEDCSLRAENDEADSDAMYEWKLKGIVKGVIRDSWAFKWSLPLCWPFRCYNCFAVTSGYLCLLSYKYFFLSFGSWIQLEFENVIFKLRSFLWLNNISAFWLFLKFPLARFLRIFLDSLNISKAKDVRKQQDLFRKLWITSISIKNNEDESEFNDLYNVSFDFYAHRVSWLLSFVRFWTENES
jgi:hypothetical protein